MSIPQPLFWDPPWESLLEKIQSQDLLAENSLSVSDGVDMPRGSRTCPEDWREIVSGSGICLKIEFLVLNTQGIFGNDPCHHICFMSSFQQPIQQPIQQPYVKRTHRTSEVKKRPAIFEGDDYARYVLEVVNNHRP